ncbi:elongation of very long chain fatty acids protein 7 [Caerostris extrusa]|uniref:Elongation of very long chain fatty acids protein n=1 Tax=Caerostris extrusa TaxID=172846 RepID=A0AAV4S1F3_CAEEX|nr:elongation of very long chain fatty acids protein 7 [Caerostris extrusa]
MTSTLIERFEKYWSFWRSHHHEPLPDEIPHADGDHRLELRFIRDVVGPALMRNHKPIQIRRLMIVYNFGLVAFYLYFLLRGAFFIPELGFQFICGSLNSYETPIIPDIFNLGYQLYVVRYIELLDTVFLVLSKKFEMVTALHVFHHSIVPVFGWFAFRSETSGYLAVFMAMNCIVHIVMYTYYAIAALGPKYQKYIWWKKYLTSLQIFQFFVMTFYTNVMFALGCTTSKFTFHLLHFPQHPLSSSSSSTITGRSTRRTPPPKIANRTELTKTEIPASYKNAMKKKL